MNTINLLKNKISELENSIEPVMCEIYELQDKLKNLEKERDIKVLQDNDSIVDKFNNAGAEFIFVDDEYDDDRVTAVVDDGTLHVNIGKVRGCFICNQELNKREFNKEVKEVMSQLGLSTLKVT